MSLVKPPTRGVPPPPPRRRGSSYGAKAEEHEEAEKPMGIAARIASLQLNQVGRNPLSKLPQESQEEDRNDELVPPPPPPPPRRRPSVEPRSTRPTQKEIESRGQDYAKALSRKPPPIPRSTVDSSKRAVPPLPPQPPALPGRRLPPKPSSLPTPPPELEQEQEPEYSLDEGYASQESESCIECHDFSVVDEHATQFPRHTVTSLDQLAYDLTAPWQSETEKCRCIFVWLHHNVAYDAENFFSGNVQPATPDSTLQSGLAVCDGYAGLFTYLAERAGLQAMKVTGHGKGFGYVAPEPGAPVPQYKGNHAWNCVLMDGEWRLIDSCWGAGALNGTTYTQRFAPIWFSSSNVEFGRRHFPDDPSYQLISEEEGGPISWEQYIMEPEGPTIFSGFYDHNFNPYFVQPSTQHVQGGTRASFTIFKLCEHMSTDEADNYVYFLSLPDETRIPMVVNSEGGWSASVYIPRVSGNLSLYCVTHVNGQDARGLGVRGFNEANGRKAMMFGGLCKWTVV